MGEQLQGDSVASVLKRLCARLRHRRFEQAQLHAHLFRHDYSTRRALDGENPSVLKRWVGHRAFAMTDRYFGIAESKLAGIARTTACWSESCRSRRVTRTSRQSHLEPGSTAVLVADDHELFRDGLRALLDSADDTKLVREASTGEEAVALAKRLSPNLVLMDIQMPGLNGIEAARRIVQWCAECRVLMLTMFEDDASVFAG